MGSKFFFAKTLTIIYFLVFNFICFFFSFVFAKEASQLNNSERFFSPNLDGKKDYLLIPLNISDKNIDKWKVEILKKKDKRFIVVKVFESLDETEYGGSVLDGVFSNSSKKNAPPKQLYWDGTDNDGEKLKDGVYYLRFYIKERRGRENTSPPLEVVLDTVAPESVAKYNDRLFSPNGDGRKEVLFFEITNKKYSFGDIVIARVFDKDGKEVRSFFEKAQSSAIAWNGLDEKGKKLPEGQYFIEIVAKDLAGNVYLLPKETITLINRVESIDLTFSHKVISPNGDGAFDIVELIPSLSSLDGLERWQIDIKKEKKIVYQIVGKKKLLPKIVYDGKDAQGNFLKDGAYNVSFSAFFNSGNNPVSPLRLLNIDTQAPKVSVSVKNKQMVFRSKSQKNLDDQDTGINFFVRQKVSGEPDDYYYSFIENDAKQIVYKKKFLGKIPEKFSWDGRNKFNSVVGGNYIYYLVGKDNVENMSVADTVPFRIVDGDIDIKLISSRLAFSPNNDGIKDNVVFIFQMNKQYLKIFKNAKIEIFDAQKNMVKLFSLDTYQKEIRWGGSDDKGNTLPDGNYFFQGSVQFSTGEFFLLPRLPIHIDRVPVKMNVFADTLFFSPNADGHKDDVLISNKIFSSEILPEYDDFSVTILDEKENVIRENSWRTAIPKKIRWNGKKRDGGVLADGVYHYVVSTEDQAGNRKKYFIKPIRLDTNKNWLALSISDSVVSSLPQAKKKSIVFSLKTSSDLHLEKLDYFLRGYDGKEFLIATTKNFESFTWLTAEYFNQNDKKNKNSSPLPSGKYFVYVQATYQNGNNSRSEEKEIFIDNDPPSNGVAAQSHLFSPDGDGKKDTTLIRFLSKDNDVVVVNRAFVFRKIGLTKNTKKHQHSLAYYQKKSVPFMIYDLSSGKSLDETIKWDGVGIQKELVKSATDYLLFFESEDRVGLKSVSQTPIAVDVLVEKLSDGRLRIILNAIQFKFDSAKMIGNYKKILRKLVNILRNFDKYKIEIVGHTDSRGSEKYNKNLSKKRAKAVYYFLVRYAGISRDRLSFLGMGKNELVIANEEVEKKLFTKERRQYFTEENYRKNRRVEFFLRRDE